MTRLRFVALFPGCMLWVVACLPASQATAAVPAPAQWTVDLPKTNLSPETTFLIKLSAQIQPGWHIYAMEEPDGGPIATQIGLAQGDPLTLLTVDEPAPRMVMDPVLRRATGMFQNHVAFTLHLRAPHTLPVGTMAHILVRYQACNDQVCLPPHTETLTFSLNRLSK